MKAETFDKYDIVQSKTDGELFLILGTCSNEANGDLSVVLVSESGRIEQVSDKQELHKNYRVYSKGCTSNVFEAMNNLRDLYNERNTPKYGTDYEEYIDRMAKEYEAEQAYTVEFMDV